MSINQYTPEKLAAISRYQNYFPTLPADVRQDTYARIAELIEEEKAYCDKGNFKHMAQILGKRNLMKLGSMCCHADIINYGALPYTDFIRTETLCQGGSRCDFRFVRHETDAGDGWDRSKSI